MTTYNNERDAMETMRIRNRAAAAAGNRKIQLVVVDGPSEGQFTTMTLREAINGEFCYRWEVS